MFHDLYHNRRSKIVLTLDQRFREILSTRDVVVFCVRLLSVGTERKECLQKRVRSDYNKTTVTCGDETCPN